MKKYKMAVLTNAIPGREAEFNEWYDQVHLGQVTDIDGFASAMRFPLAHMMSEGKSYMSLAIYEIETDDLEATLKELRRRSGTDRLIVSAALDTADLYAGIYEVKPD